MSRAGTLAGPGPKGWLRWLLRLPGILYRLRLGWLLGRRFLELAHVGRRSGRWRRTVLEVVRYDRRSGVCIVASGWGEKAQWFRNILANPQVEVTLGVRSRRATAQRLPLGDAEKELRDYAQRRPRAMGQLVRFMLGRPPRALGEDCRELARDVPLIELSPVAAD